MQGEPEVALRGGGTMLDGEEQTVVATKSTGTEIMVTTSETQLWMATENVGMKAWPEDPPASSRIEARTGAPAPETQ